MSAKKILFRTDGDIKIGTGHIIRSLALADMLKQDFKIYFACQKLDSNLTKIITDNGYELIGLPVCKDYLKDAENLISHLDQDIILVLDNYFFTENYQQAVKKHCKKLVSIDDLNEGHFYSDVVISHSEHLKGVNYSCEKYTETYLGGDFALLRKPFLESSNFERNFESNSKILICLGGADPTNQTLRIIQALNLTQKELTVKPVIGVSNPNYKIVQSWVTKNQQNSKLKIEMLSNLSPEKMTFQMQNSDLIFCAGSGIAWEVCCIGLPMIVGIIADNQIGIADVLGKKEAAISLGWYKDISIKEIADSFAKLISDDGFLKTQVFKQKKIVDGKSAQRLLNIFNRISK